MKNELYLFMIYSHYKNVERKFKDTFLQINHIH